MLPLRGRKAFQLAILQRHSPDIANRSQGRDFVCGKLRCTQSDERRGSMSSHQRLYHSMMNLPIPWLARQAERHNFAPFNRLNGK